MTTATIPTVSSDAPVRLTWSRIEELTQRLIAQADGDGLPETLVGIMRGGMIPAVMIAHQLGIRDVRTIEVTHTVSDTINAAKTNVPAYKNPASIGDLAGRDVLLVDDIAGSGATLARTCRMVEARGTRRLRTAVLAVNQANWHAPTGPEASIDYIAEQTDTWVIFPWEVPDNSASPAAAGALTAPKSRLPWSGTALMSALDRS